MSRSFHKIHLPFTQPRTVFSATGQLYERLHLLSRPLGKNVISSQFVFERGHELRASFLPLLDIIFGQEYRETSIGVLKRFSMHRYIYISDPINARRYAPPPPLPNKNGMHQFSCNDRLNPLEERRTSHHYQRPEEGENDKIVSDEMVDDGGGPRLRFEIIIRVSPTVWWFTWRVVGESPFFSAKSIPFRRGWKTRLFQKRGPYINSIWEYIIQPEGRVSPFFFILELWLDRSSQVKREILRN